MLRRQMVVAVASTAVMVLVASQALAAPPRIAASSGSNLLVNGDFELGDPWTGGNPPTGACGAGGVCPEGWVQIQGGADNFQPPVTGADAIGGSGRSLYARMDGNRGWFMGQDNLGAAVSDWQLSFDFAIEQLEPQGSGTDGTGMNFQVLGAFDAGTDGLTQSQLRTQSVGGTPWLSVRNPGMNDITEMSSDMYSPDVQTAAGRKEHVFILEGHMADPTPWYQIWVLADGGAEYTSGMITSWRGASVPSATTLLDSMRIVATNWDARGDFLVDNIYIGLIPEPATAALLAFGGLLIGRRRR